MDCKGFDQDSLFKEKPSFSKENIFIHGSHLLKEFKNFALPDFADASLVVY